MRSESGITPTTTIGSTSPLNAIAALCGATAFLAFTTPQVDAQSHIISLGKRADGRAVHRYEISNATGLSLSLSDLGAGITSIRAPDRAGQTTDILVHPGSDAEMIATTKRYGRVVGRYAGRLAGGFKIGGRFYPLKANASGATLHGSDPGLDQEIWRGRFFATSEVTGVKFSLISPDGAQGFPGTLHLAVRYELARNANRLTIRYAATTHRATVLNLTNHAYFNLAGGGAIGCHTLSVDADRYVETDARHLPTGDLPKVDGTPLDFRKPVQLAKVLAGSDPLIRATSGLDHMLLLRAGGLATLTDPVSGRTLTIGTDQPGLQVYTANALDGSERDARGQPIRSHDAIALETGRLPDSPNQPAFPSAALLPGKPYHAVTTLDFSTVPKPANTTSCTTNS